MSKNKSPLIPIVSTLTIIGLIYLSASLPEAKSTLNDQFYFLKRQFLWVALSLVAYFTATKIKLSVISQLSPYLYLISIVLLALIFLPSIGHSSLGAKRWLNLWGLTLQPSEIVKLTAIIFFSKIFSENKQTPIKALLLYLIPPLILIILEPNLSTTVIIFATIVSLFYLSNGNTLHLTTLLLFTTVAIILLTISSPYRNKRLQTLLQINSSTTTESYHQKQITLTLGSGGLLGKGLGQSDQKFQFLPKIATDSIFAVIGEELGFVGTVTIIGLYITLITHLLRLSKKLNNQYASLLTAGVACWLGYQTIIHLAAVTSLIPLTGVPLPFISYGGSALLCLSFAIGLIYNIEKNYAKEDYSHRRHPPHPRHRTNQAIT